VIIGDGWFPAFVMPEHLRRCEADDQKIPERPGLLEKLEMAGVEDVVATADEDRAHKAKLETGDLKPEGKA
jgi:hypothetical protein